MKRENGAINLVPKMIRKSEIVCWLKVILEYIFLKAKYSTKINPKGTMFANGLGFVVNSLAKQF